MRTMITIGPADSLDTDGDTAVDPTPDTTPDPAHGSTVLAMAVAAVSWQLQR